MASVTRNGGNQHIPEGKTWHQLHSGGNQRIPEGKTWHLLYAMVAISIYQKETPGISYT